MTQNPYSPSPQQAAAWNEGFSKAFISNSSFQPSGAIGPDESEAFNAGVSAGVDAQTNGIDLGLSCTEAAESSEEAETGSEVFEDLERAADIAKYLSKPTVAAAFEAGIVTLVLTLITNPLSTQPPDQVLPSLQQPLIDSLAAMGLDNVVLFCGVGADPSQPGCELKVSPFFKSQDQAQSASTSMGRPSTTVISWRTDQCGSFTVVA